MNEGDQKVQSSSYRMSSGDIIYSMSSFLKEFKIQNYCDLKILEFFWASLTEQKSRGMIRKDYLDVCLELLWQFHNVINIQFSSCSLLCHL